MANWVKFTAATLASYVVMAGLAAVLFGWVFSEAFAPLMALFRPAEEQVDTAIWAYLAQFIRTFIFAGVFVLLNGSDRVTLKKGALFGVLMGLFAGTFHIANSASLPLPAVTAVSWLAFDTILLTLGGLVFAAIYGLRSPRRAD